jgi:hypothetical protein
MRTEIPEKETPRCCICGRPVGEKAVTYELTEREKHVMRVLLQDDGPVVYCRACDQLSKSPKAFAEFMKGLLLSRMRAAGVPDALAEARAKRQYDFYLQKALASQGRKALKPTS